MNLTDRVGYWKAELASNWTVTTLKTAIVLWSITIIIVTVFFIDNPYVLAGIFLYEVLP